MGAHHDVELVQELLRRQCRTTVMLFSQVVQQQLRERFVKRIFHLHFGATLQQVLVRRIHSPPCRH